MKPLHDCELLSFNPLPSKDYTNWLMLLYIGVIVNYTVICMTCLQFAFGHGAQSASFLGPSSFCKLYTGLQISMQAMPHWTGQALHASGTCKLD